MEKLLKVLTDPVSNKILQMIRIKKQVAISEILLENPSVLRATLYRKIEKNVGGWSDPILLFLHGGLGGSLAEICSAVQVGWE